jgi:isopentenyl phosphate kinase
MAKQLVAIKLGGSLITIKNKPFTVQEQHIELFSRELFSVRREWPATDFLIGNGSGSFGHFTAHQYGLREGAHNPAQFYGMCVTHNAVLKLSLMVADTLCNEGVPTFAVSPSSMITCNQGEVAEVNLAPIKVLLENGCVPLLHGDTMTDLVVGTTIMSTEEILLACMREVFTVYDRIVVIYLLDVDGVLDQSGSRIPELGPEDTLAVNRLFHHDVTGGIAAKVAAARKAAYYADTVYLIDGRSPGMLRRAMQGQDVGTRVLAGDVD